MKKTLFLLTMALMPGVRMAAQDAFTVDGYNYEVISTENHTAKFTRWIGGEGSAKFEQEQHLVIPSSVTYNNVEYTVTEIGDWMHDNIMSELTIPATVSAIDESAFEGCENLTTIHFASTANNLVIGASSFQGCIRLAQFSFPEGLVSVGESAFANTSVATSELYTLDPMTTINIPASLTYIHPWAFDSWEGYAATLNYVVSDGNTVYDSRNGCGIVETATNKLIRASKGTVPEGIVSIGAYAFCKQPVGNVTIPTTVTSIHANAFKSCAVNSFTVADGNEYYAVLSDQILYEVATGNKLGFCSHTTIPAGTTNISYWFHLNPACPSSITIPGSVTNMEMAFSSSNVQNVTVAEGVSTISNSAFTDCKQLSSITLPTSLRTIGYAAFEGCTALTSLTIPEGVTTIEGDAFDGCTSLATITLPSTLTTIADQIFMGCTSLTEIILPSKVVGIASKTFAECTNLTSVTIPASVETVAEDAFEGCDNLAEIHLPANPDDIQFDVAVLPVSASLIYDVIDDSPVTATTVTLAANYTTFCSSTHLNFASVAGLKAYIVSGYDEGYVLMTRVTNVPAGTGLVLYGTSGQSYDIPAGNGRAVLSNLLIGVTENTTIFKTEGNYTNFILARGSDGTIGFHPLKSASSTLGAGKAYLHLPTWAVETPSGVRSFRLIADDGTTFDETTGIADVQTEQGGAECFDVQGRRVKASSMQKGLYIIDGRKVILK